MQATRCLIAAGLALGLFAVTGSAFAETPDLYDWQHPNAPVMVHTEGGVVFLGKERAPRRAYSWDPAESETHDHFFAPDIDGDGSYEIVGAGDPTFALQTSSDPSWSIEDGCDQGIVADFAANDKMDVMCMNGDAIDVYTYDRQKVWSAELGVPLEWCRAGDVNGDLKADIECKLRGRDSYTRIDVNAGKLMAQESKEAKLDKGKVDLDEAQPVSSKVWTGKKEFDLNGDGAVEESLKADGSALVIQSRSKEKAVARIEFDDAVEGALVKNLDGKKKPEIVVVTEESIVVADAKGKKLGTYPVDADDYDREPIAALDTLYARGFEDNENAQQAVRDVQDELAACYSDRVEGNLFVGIGQVIYKLTVDGDGGVSNTEQMHSAIRDDEVESCAQGVLEDLDYPTPKAKDDKKKKDATATLNVTLKFTFEDTPR